jgi:Tfp pilus assembly PilM family ATPase
MLSGVLDLPVALAASEWQSEVQVEASRALGLEPDDISFDFQASGSTDGLVIRLHWVACGLSLVNQLNQCVREVGGQLSSVEPAREAASRAAYLLRGGLASVLTQPVQDWQFDHGSIPSPGAFDAAGAAWVIDEDWLQDALHSTAGPRLIASGLALRGLH